jgi:hypothetical protein
MSLTDIGLRIKKLFPVLRIKIYLTGVGIGKRDGYPPIELLFVFVNLLFFYVNSVHDLTRGFVGSFFEARKDTFDWFKNAEWSWRLRFSRQGLWPNGSAKPRTLRSPSLLIETLKRKRPLLRL